MIFLLAKVFPSCAGTSDYKSLNSRETRQFHRISTTSQKSNDSMFQKVVFMIGTGGNFTELSEVVPHLLTPPESPSLLRKVANDFWGCKTTSFRSGDFWDYRMLAKIIFIKKVKRFLCEVKSFLFSLLIMENPKRQ